MKRGKTKKKYFCCICKFFLIFIILFSIVPHFVYAEKNVFSGIEDIEVKENETINLLQEVSANEDGGEKLQVKVSNIVCENNKSYSYDGTNTLTVGKAGTIYIVEYTATSTIDSAKKYTAYRKITVLQSNVNNMADDITDELTDRSEIMALNSGLPIIYENGIHYITDPEYPNERITLFCMNNQLNWPHLTPNMGNIQIPNYTEGYLTPDNFKSKEDYENCMRRLSKLLYSGYPYNAERLYKIVKNEELTVPTEVEFNEMLIASPQLIESFPNLRNYRFTLHDETDHNQRAILNDFIKQVLKLYPKGSTSNGLTYEDITAMPFYKAAWCLVADYAEGPLVAYAHLYSSSYFVTEKQAYDATQAAIWRLLNDYGIEQNNINTLNYSELSKVLFTYSNRGSILNYEPTVDKLQLKGDLTFTYNPKDGMWHSGKLMLIEPSDYHGLYELNLPKGVSAQCDNQTYIYGNEEYELVSDHKPQDGEIFGIKADFFWLKDLKQYSPTPDIEVNGKKFQHMVGAVIRNKTLTAQFAYNSSEEGSLEISKTLIGESSKEEFSFKIELPNHKINGKYGDLEFTNGVSYFYLKPGEKVTVTNLPVGADYIVREDDFGEYQVDSTNSKGTISANQTIKVNFTNRALPDLTLSKIVTGEAGDKTKKFTFVINLKDSEGNTVNEIYDYLGVVKSGYENEAVKPDDGKIEFTNGTAEILLSHGQQIIIKNLPFDCTYTVTEKEANTDNYITTYNGEKDIATGKLEKNITVDVVNNKEFVPETGIGDIDNHSINIGMGIAITGIFILVIIYILRLSKVIKG
ncbi:DUF5979 domain-containing protein [Clostridium perfringens]|uniref:DUF7601 domain-containing protein n=1 Tax=Clostridium perfringens TaxID=1502 RepID=UPI003754DA28|nr:hypothetical protein [Clostridium perfringens]MDK0866016.1 DUF5979 domain-containing protein [Clostridium perfringens]